MIRRLFRSLKVAHLIESARTHHVLSHELSFRVTSLLRLSPRQASAATPLGTFLSPGGARGPAALVWSATGVLNDIECRRRYSPALVGLWRR